MGPEKRIFLEIFLIFALALLLFLTYFLSAIYRQQKKLRKFDEEKLKAEIIAANQERNKIATEIHNDVAPHLTSIIFETYQLEKNIQDQKEKILTSLSQCLEKLRYITKEISPLHYYGITFEEAIDAYIRNHRFNESIDIQITFSVENKMNEHEKELLFRIIQEIILNTVKHAEATHLKILTEVKNEIIYIKTADNGKGYDSRAILGSKRKNGFGLMSIISRVHYLGGTFEHDLSRDPGTRYLISIPLRHTHIT